MSVERKTYHYEEIIEVESEQLRERRRRLAEVYEEEVEDFDTTKFGLALSGGGIRSATINLGFLRTLNLFGLLRRADYLSTVSGGGYTGAYIQATLKKTANYSALFADEHIRHMRTNGEYLIPGQTVLTKFGNTLILIIGYLSSLAMSLFSPAILVSGVLIAYRLIDSWIAYEPTKNPMEWFAEWLQGMVLPILLGVVALHFLANLIAKFSLTISHLFNVIETTIVGVVLIVFVPVLLIFLSQENEGTQQLPLDEANLYLLVLLGLVVVGFFTNPNALSFHRFYRSRLARAFLAHTGKWSNAKLKDLFSLNDTVGDWIAPYPLINTCLNLQNPGGGEKFKGTKASDYFLLSPLYSGAKLTGYVSTPEFPGYDVMSLPAATTISAAALNPGMGNYSNKLLSVLMTIFNARLGYWVNNPLKKSSKHYVVWWPLYFFYELLSKMGSSNRKVNISDGGHIENLGVYELLRRRCRLILAVDGGADPEFLFYDLENLTVRARNELGIEIRFRDSMIPEEVMRVRPSKGYSDKRFAIADLYQIWEEFPLTDPKGRPFLDEEKEEVEVLVNYVPDGELDPEIYLKGCLTKEMHQKYRERAIEMVNDKLAIRGHLNGKEKLKFGTLVYIKSSVTAPMLKPFMQPREEDSATEGIWGKTKAYVRSFFVADDTDQDYTYDTYKYKIYHPAFPHESTADQFFDPVQWESYYQLGQFIGADVLGLHSHDFLNVRSGQQYVPPMSILELIEHFDRIGVETEKSQAPTLIRARSVEEEAVPAKPEEEAPVQPPGDQGHIGYSM